MCYAATAVLTWPQPYIGKCPACVKHVSKAGQQLYILSGS